MRTTTLQQDLDAHNNRLKYNKTLLKTFIGGLVIGITAWEIGELITNIIINLIK